MTDVAHVFAFGLASGVMLGVAGVVLFGQWEQYSRWTNGDERRKQ